jgi:peroxiredoxin
MIQLFNPLAAKIYTWLLICLCCGLLSAAQTSETPLYQKQALPSFTIRLLDSTSLFHTGQIAKGKPTVLILFSPDCSHCAQIAQSVKNRIAEFEGINLYFISPPMPFYEIRRFAHINGLVGKSQITVGQDIDFFFGSFFKADTVPFVVLYDRQKKFAAVLKHMKNIDELLAETAKLK